MKLITSIIYYLFIFLTVCLVENCSPISQSEKNSNNSSSNFGDSIPVSNGLLGKIFLLTPNTTSLPDFDTMKSLGVNLFIHNINIQPQIYTSGFPGLKNRYEWFGIRYTGLFETPKTGNYRFRLLSDDGSKLYIDGKQIIDNDGLHSSLSKSGNILLNNALHTIRLDYFQGPRNTIALQLFWQKDTAKEEIFPGKNFKLVVSKLPTHFPWWILISLSLTCIIIICLLRNRNK